MTPAAPVPFPGPAPPAARAGVQSVERAIDVLEALAGRGPLGISEVAVVTGLADGTAHRLLRTLVSRGYARQGSDRRYSLGTRLLSLGEGARRALVSRSRPLLERVVELSGETANLAVLEGDSVVYVAQAPSAHRLRLFAEVGRHVHAHSTAVGKVLLSSLPDAEITALLGRTGMPERTARTRTDPAHLLHDVARVRRVGYAVDDEEEELGVRCLAVPVVDSDSVVAALSVSGPATRVPARPRPGLVAGLREVALAFTAPT